MIDVANSPSIAVVFREALERIDITRFTCDFWASQIVNRCYNYYGAPIKTHLRNLAVLTWTRADLQAARSNGSGADIFPIDIVINTVTAEIDSLETIIRHLIDESHTHVMRLMADGVPF